MAQFLIVDARFYDHLNDMLIAGARKVLEDAGHEVEVLKVPGALEIPGAIASASESDRFDGYVAIGVLPCPQLQRWVPVPCPEQDRRS